MLLKDTLQILIDIELTQKTPRMFVNESMTNVPVSEIAARGAFKNMV